MTSPSGPAVMGGAAGKGSRSAAAQPRSDAEQAGQGQAADPGPWWMRALPSLVMLAVTLTGITVPSFWRDEAATLAAVHRSFGALFSMLGHVDAVHGAYYLLAWAIARLFGTGELALRLPSAIAMSIAAGFVGATGRRLVSPAAGLAAGLLFAAIPQISFYGQDARSYALVTAMAAVASYLLVRALQAAPGQRRRWWLGYAGALALLGILNIFALLLIPAHAVTVALRCLRPGAGNSRRALALSWLAAAVAAGVLASPLLYYGFKQRGQVSWLKTPDGLQGINQLIGPWRMAVAAGVAVAAGLIVSAVAGRARFRARWPGPLAQLSLPWLILPPAILLTGSLITPMYTFRYILFCIPAVALLGGTALASLGRFVGPAAFVVIVLLGLHSQVLVREAAGHKDNIRQADHIIAEYRRHGDVVLYTNPNAQTFGAAYPYGLDRLRDISLAKRGIPPSGPVVGEDVSETTVRQRLAHVSRLWVININRNMNVPIIYGLHFHLIRSWRTSDIWLRLYVHQHSAHQHRAH